MARATIGSRALNHEKWLAFALALLVALVAYEPRVRAGGFNADDWPEYAAFRFPKAAGFQTAMGALEHDAGSRVGHMFYWLLSFSLFGGHTRLYTATAGMLAVIMAFSVYLLLRELNFSLVQSAGVMLLTIVAPSVSTDRFWFTPAGTQISSTLFFVGLIFALKAFVAPVSSRRRLHLISWSLYVASAVYAETALPLMGISILVYLTRAPMIESLRRWRFDLLVVIGGFAATFYFVNSHPGFTKLPSSMWVEHARMIADQAITIFSQTLAPFAGTEQSLVVTMVAIVVAMAFALWRLGDISTESRRILQRWGIAFAISLISIIACYAVFVPAMLYYEPLGPGLASHINSATAAPLAIGLFAVLVFARVAIVELFGRQYRVLSLLVLCCVVAWYGVMFFDSIADVRSNAHIWALASERGNDLLRTLTKQLPKPRHDATIYTFGEAGTVAPGLPIFFTSWELNNAVKVAYDRPDISAYPMVINGMTPICTAEGIVAKVETTQINSPSLYGVSYFIDIQTGEHVLVGSRRECVAFLRQFPLGPYSYSTLEWAV